jgi:hypothetical protein
MMLVEFVRNQPQQEQRQGSTVSLVWAVLACVELYTVGTGRYGTLRHRDGKRDGTIRHCDGVTGCDGMLRHCDGVTGCDGMLRHCDGARWGVTARDGVLRHCDGNVTECYARRNGALRSRNREVEKLDND